MIEQVSNGYRGHARVKRLMHFAQTAKSAQQCVVALNQAISCVKQTDYYPFYLSILQRSKKLTLQKWKIPSPPAALIKEDIDWTQDRKRQMMKQVEQKHNDIQKVQITKVKDSIRHQITLLAEIYCNYGDLNSGIQQFTRAIGMTPPGKQLIRIALHTAHACIDQQSYNNALKFLQDVSNIINSKQQELNSILNALLAIVYIHFKSWKNACACLNSISKCQLPQLNTIISQGHMGAYLLFTALIAQPRHSLSLMIKTSNFTKISSLAPKEFQNMITYYLDSNYSEMFRCINLIEIYFANDYYIGRELKKQLKDIREKAYLQYVSPYSRVSLSQISEELYTKPQQLMQIFIDFIRKGKLQAKIDMDKMILEKDSVFDQEKNIRRANQLLKKFLFQIESSCYETSARVSHKQSKSVVAKH